MPNEEKEKPWVSQIDIEGLRYLRESKEAQEDNQKALAIYSIFCLISLGIIALLTFVIHFGVRL